MASASASMLVDGDGDAVMADVPTERLSPARDAALPSAPLRPPMNSPLSARPSPRSSLAARDGTPGREQPTLATATGATARQLRSGRNLRASHPTPDGVDESFLSARPSEFPLNLREDHTTEPFGDAGLEPRGREQEESTLAVDASAPEHNTWHGIPNFMVRRVQPAPFLRLGSPRQALTDVQAPFPSPRQARFRLPRTGLATFSTPTIMEEVQRLPSFVRSLLPPFITYTDQTSEGHAATIQEGPPRANRPTSRDASPPSPLRRPRDSLELIDPGLPPSVHARRDAATQSSPLRIIPRQTARNPAFLRALTERQDRAFHVQDVNARPERGRRERDDATRIARATRVSHPPPPQGECTACMEEFMVVDLLNLACGCRYCPPCLNAAFTAGCTSRAAFPPKCCGRPLRISAWGSLLAPQVLQRYKLVEAEFGATRPLYCALESCSAFIPDDDKLAAHEVGVCLDCQKVTCRRCRQLMDKHPRWDAEGRICPPADTGTSALYDLGNECKWKQCPTCLTMVERTEGCNHVDCICGVEFCYQCGKLFDEDDECACDPDAWEGDEDDGPQSDEFEEEEDDHDHDDGAGSDEERWPNFRSAVDAMGRPLCRHQFVHPLDGDDLPCHGCLQPGRLQSCNDCGLELCTPCVEAIRQSRGPP